MASDYTIKVEDFGPIAEASVDLRPLTVFIGPSNTGKSYLAGLIYALHRSLNTPRPLWPRSFLNVPRGMRFRARPLGAKVAQEVEQWAMASAVLEPNAEVPPLPDDSMAFIKQTLEESVTLSRALTAQVARCFGVEDTTLLTRHGSKAEAPALKLLIPFGENRHTSFNTVLSPKGETFTETQVEAMEFTVSMIERMVEGATVLVEHHDEDVPLDEPRFDARRFLGELTEHTFGEAFAPLTRKSAYYLPADRTGVMHSHHVVVSALVQRASLAGIRRFDDVPMLSGVMADFLDLLVSHISQLERRPPRSAKVRALAKAMEQRILGGNIRVNLGEVRYPSFAYRPSGWKEDLPLMRASSMVSELAPIVLYLRHVVQPEDILIIEEPESHLHPSMQAAFARELALLVNAGIRVVMTTHSEWFLEQIGNLVRASELPPDKRPREEILDHEQVGAWLFDPRTRSKGSVVREVRIDPETGLYPTDYDAVSDTLYNESADIFNQLHEDVAE